MRLCPTAALLLAATTAAAGQSPGPAPIDWSADDSARVAFLSAHGRSYPAPPVIVWAPVDSLDSRWLASFADSLGGAVGRLQTLIGGPFPWQRLASRPIRYYISPGRFVSHADGRGGVFVSLERVRHRDAPLLHEAAHELLAPPLPFLPFEYPDSLAGERAAAAFPFWLSEGLPDYLAQATAAAAGFPEGDVFAIGGLARVDSVCAARLGGSRRRAEILERVGRSGRLEPLFTTDRATVAPVYYACSQSFTKHLVARIGLPAVVALFPRIPAGTWQSALESAARQPLERLRETWLAGLGQGSTSADSAAIIALELEMSRLLGAGRFDEYATHLASDYARTTQQGRLELRDAALASWRARGAGGPMLPTELWVRVYGDAAVLTGVVGGANSSGRRARITKTFVRQQGEWRLAALHGSAIGPR